MARRKTYEPLVALLNNIPVGILFRQPNGALSFQYDKGWLARDLALPISLSLPLRESLYRGNRVDAVFENLLPDSNQTRTKIARIVGASDIDAHSLLSVIGRDCVGALQFVPEGDFGSLADSTAIEGKVVDDTAIEAILNCLGQSPLGMSPNSSSRLSLSGTQEKTALLLHEGKWMRPMGATATTHIFKTQIGRLPWGIDLSNSVENEYYCLKLLEQFGLAVNKVDIQTFGSVKTLVIERFDRLWAQDGRLLRVAQEDCCQALSVLPAVKYEAAGGPGISQISRLLLGNDDPQNDQLSFFKAQILSWLMGGVGVHAKNFSLFIGSGGTSRLCPLYGILSLQPYFHESGIGHRKMRVSMGVGDNRHYVSEDIYGRHFIQSGLKARLPKSLARLAIDQICAAAEPALTSMENLLPSDFPEDLHRKVSTGMRERLNRLDG